MFTKCINNLKTALGVLTITMVTVTLSGLSTEAVAQSGSRVCVNSAGTYAFEIKKGRGTRKTCERGKVYSDAGNWGTGQYMTCEHFAVNYLSWDWDVCQEMPRQNRKIDWSTYYDIPNSAMYKISSLPRDFGIKSTASPCGADLCALGVNAGRSSSFGYTAGVNVNVAELFDFNVSYTATQGADAGWSYTCTYKRGHWPGMRIEPVNTNQVYSAFNYNDLFSSTHCYVKGISDEDRDRVLSLNSCIGKKGQWHQMTRLINGSPVNYTELNYMYDQPLALAVSPGYGSVDYGVAKEKYDQLKNTVYSPNPLYFHRTGDRRVTRVHCGPQLAVATNPNVWRDGYSKVKWKVGMQEVAGWENQ